MAPRSPRRSSSGCGGSIPRRSSASTATVPGKRRRSAPRRRALPMLRPNGRCALSTLPEGKDPDDVVRTGGKEAFEALLAGPEPLDATAVAPSSVAAEPLTTPEARAGLKRTARSLMPQAIGRRGPRPALPRGMAQALPSSAGPAAEAAPRPAHARTTRGHTIQERPLRATEGPPVPAGSAAIARAGSTGAGRRAR